MVTLSKSTVYRKFTLYLSTLGVLGGIPVLMVYLGQFFKERFVWTHGFNPLQLGPVLRRQYVMRRVCIGEGLLVKSKSQEGTGVPCLLKQRAICNLLKSPPPLQCQILAASPLAWRPLEGTSRPQPLATLLLKGKKKLY